MTPVLSALGFPSATSTTFRLLPEKQGILALLHAPWWRDNWLAIPQRARIYWVPLVMLAVLALLDIISTEIGLSMGFYEETPFMAYLMEQSHYLAHVVKMVALGLISLGLLFIDYVFTLWIVIWLHVYAVVGNFSLILGVIE